VASSVNEQLAIVNFKSVIPSVAIQVMSPI